MADVKPCLVCGQEILLGNGVSPTHLAKRLTCSKPCANELRRRNYATGNVKANKIPTVDDLLLSPLSRWDKPLTRDEIKLVRAELGRVQRRLTYGVAKAVRVKFEAAERRLLDVLRYLGNAWMREGA